VVVEAGEPAGAGEPPRAAPTELVDPWFVYVVRCSDGSLYTGVARDVDKRIQQHNEGRGAKYTRGRGPVVMLASSPALARGDALRLEVRAKRLRAQEKLDAVRLPEPAEELVPGDE
jgi:putative endonuclease